jgi:hypothetical protein
MQSTKSAAVPDMKVVSVEGRAVDRLRRIMDVIHKHIDGRFTGYLKINIQHGSIGRIEKFEEILKK